MTIQINPREIAVQALLEILKEEKYNTTVLRKLLRQNGAMPPKDRAFVTEIVNGSLRNLYYIDFVIDNVSHVKMKKIKPYILAVLRTAIYQLYFMKVPENAICDESVKLVKKRGLTSLSGFVNAVLRNAIRQKDSIVFPDEKQYAVEYLCLKYSHPIWLLKMWLHQYDYDFVKALCIQNNVAPDVSIVVNTLCTTKQELKKELEQCGIVVKESKYYQNVLHLQKTANIAKLQSYHNGKFHVQDESSVTAVEVLSPQPNESILDICAAPGGKSFLIAEKMQNKGNIYSCDIYQHKLELLQEGAERLSISIITPKQQDGTIYQKQYEKAFDRVLVDAPCSGLGLIRKKPDIRLKKNGNDIDNILIVQKNILKQAAQYVKQNGILVYSTCTICKKENEKNVEWFLEQYKNFELEDIRTYLPSEFYSETAENGYVTLYPHIHHTDGFFIARFIRKE